MTWPSEVKWPGGIAPALTAEIGTADIVTFYYSGGNYYGNISFNYQ